MKNIKEILKNYWLEFAKLDLVWRVLIILGVLVGSLFRLFNLFNLGFLFDMVSTQYTWGKAGFEMGYFGFWANYRGPFDYLPLSLILEIILYTLSLPFGGSAQNFVTMMKILNWVVEIVLSLWITKIALDQLKTSDIKKSVNITARAFLFGILAYILPSLWFVSGVWGQNDSLIVVLTFWSITLMYRKDVEEKVIDSSSAVEETIDKIEPFYKNKYFLSGLVLGVTIWIKQQAILVFPVLILYHLVGKSWKDLRNFLIYTIPFVTIFALGLRSYQNGQWQITAVFGAILIISFSLIQLIFVNKSDNWQNLRRQVVGFILPTLVILVPLIFVNYERTGATTFAVAGRADVVANGGATSWTLLEAASVGSQGLLNFGIFEISISTAGYLLYILFMVVLVWRIFDITFSKLRSLDLSIIFSKSLSFVDFCILMFVNTSAYFLFFTKMYSRYLHFGVIFSLIVLALLSQSKLWKGWFWGVLILHLGYFLNQVVMYSVSIFDLKNTEPAWVYDFLNGFNFSVWNGSAVLSLFAFALLYPLCLQYYDKPEKLDS